MLAARESGSPIKSTPSPPKPSGRNGGCERSAPCLAGTRYRSALLAPSIPLLDVTSRGARATSSTSTNPAGV
ncbi:hypothetical protein Pmani_021421 [Petrolisthes manimaculis]|uniref:Uncharacterized protein n=1 Tax=Petrolisthes manimaculis TaxID=1843537 RepID=A0AAE1PFS3_9EUCA|nr:hypothetical protein Pmani_021421 [Petrolisthes manimaculis]